LGIRQDKTVILLIRVKTYDTCNCAHHVIIEQSPKLNLNSPTGMDSEDARSSRASRAELPKLSVVIPDSVAPNSTPRETGASLDRDVFHDNLDKEVLDRLKVNSQFGIEPNLGMLLAVIASRNSGVKRLVYDDADELLAREPSLKAVLQEAWKQRSFKAVRTLRMFGVKLKVICDRLIIKYAAILRARAPRLEFVQSPSDLLISIAQSEAGT
jgi:hypothetical protein